MATDKCNLYKRGDTYYLRYRVKGKLIVQSLKVKTLSEAKEKRKELLNTSRDIKTEEDVINKIARVKKLKQPLSKPLTNVIPEFISYFETARSKPGEHLLKVYCYWIDQFLIWLKTNFAHIKYFSEVSNEIAKLYARSLHKTGISNKTYNEQLNCLVRLFKVVGGMAYTPFDKKNKEGGVNIDRLNKETVSRKEFTREEIKKILDSFQDMDIPFKQEYEVLFYLAIFSGFRQKDAVLLQWSDVNFPQNIIAVTPYKTRSHNIKVQIPIHPWLKQKLLEAKNWKINQDVLPNIAVAYRISPKKVEKVIMSILRINGFKNENPDKAEGEKDKRTPCLYGMHSFRYSFVSFCAESGVPMAVVQDIVGHTNVAMTKHYTRISNEYKQSAIQKLQIATAIPSSQSTLIESIISRLRTAPEKKLLRINKILEK